jgi:hypothetical protein
VTDTPINLAAATKVESMAAALYAEYYQITWAEALVSLQSGVEVGDEFRRLAQIAIDHMDYIKDLPDER